MAGILLVLFVLAASTGIAALLFSFCGRIDQFLGQAIHGGIGAISAGTGAIHAGIGLIPAASGGAVHLQIQDLAEEILCGRPWIRILAEGILCGRLLALRSLGEAGFSVRDPLLQGDVEKARQAVSMIVGRDTQRLDEEGIAKAAVETVAENTSDGVTAPLFYMILFGGLGGTFYKAVNTMDSMIGYSNDRYQYFGTAAARLDDVMNFLPSRLTALFMILACMLPGHQQACIKSHPDRISDRIPQKTGADNVTADPERGMEAGRFTQRKGDFGEYRMVYIPDAAAALRIWRRDRLKSPSPNSAQTESVCAGALYLRLLGDTWYFGELHHKKEIGDGGRRVEPEDITRSVRLMNRTALLMLLAALAVLVSMAL